MFNKEYIITFDIWGTILNNISYKIQRIAILQKYLEELGYPLEIEDISKAYSGMNSYLKMNSNEYRYVPLNVRFDVIIKTGLNIKLDNQEMLKLIDLFQCPLIDHPPLLNKYVIEMIQQLSEYAYLGLISDTGFSMSSTLEGVLQKQGLNMSYFIYRNYSERTGYNKPHNAMFRNIVENEYNIPKNHIYHIGDCYSTDVVGAIQNNINSIFIDRDVDIPNVILVKEIVQSKHYTVGSLQDAWNILQKRLV